MNNLLPIKDFIHKAKTQGATFGHGDAKIHLAYLTKIGILPQATKRKLNGEITGCYAQEEIQTLLRVEEMKAKGMTYSQISKTLLIKHSQQDSSLVANSYLAPPSQQSESVSDQDSYKLKATSSKLISNPSFLYMIIGVLIGFLLSTLNAQGLEQMRRSANLSLSATPSLTDYQSRTDSVLGLATSQSQQSPQPIYVIAVPKQNLDKLEKTNINYLINN